VAERDWTLAERLLGRTAAVMDSAAEWLAKFQPSNVS
jgi:hypothetical protein